MRTGTNKIEIDRPEAIWSLRASKIGAQTFLLAGIIAVSSNACAQSAMPDSQVEANVLKALASAPDLASQAITTNTVYGVVTLSGSVSDDASRTKADNLAANAAGVKKVVDQLQVGATVSKQDGSAQGAGAGTVLQSDGTYAPADQGANTSTDRPIPGSAPAAGAVMNDPDNDQAAYAQPQPNGQPAVGQAPYGQTAPNTQAQQAPPSQANGPAPYPQNGYPQTQQNGYPPYPQNRYPQPTSYGNGQPWGGQQPGQNVAVPAGTMIRVRVDRLIASNKVKPGDVFNGWVANDVVADGFVAIPRGAAVQGTVVDAKSSGAISGRGELSIQLTSVTMGGKVYPVVSDVWAHDGYDKTIQTVNSAAGLGVMGALIGAVAGRGAGAAIGAGVGAGAGIAASAASPRGQVVIPPEGMVMFHLAQPAQVTTVSEQEMQRLAYGTPSNAPRQPMYGRPYGYGYPPPPPAYGYPPY